MKLKFLFLFFTFLYSFNVCSQKVIVLEKDTNNPLPGVSIIGNTEIIQTNIDGEAYLDLFTDNELLIFKNKSYNEIQVLKSDLIKTNYMVYLMSRVDLDEIVISASKFKQSSRDIPQKIVNITAKEIEFTNPQTSADLLESTGNVFIQKSQLGGGSPMIRGFSTNRLLITVDGVRMNNAIFRSGNLQNVISIDPFTIQNTEITLGAGSVVYGSDAIGGVMSFYTKKPQLSYKDDLYFKANTLIRYASANFEKTGHIDLNFGLKKWAFLTSFSFSDYDDLRMGKHGPDDYLRPEYVETINGIDTVVSNDNPLVQNPTAFNQFNLMQKVLYEPKEDLNLELGIYFSRTSNYSRYDRLLLYRDDNLKSAEWYYGPQQWLMANFQYTKLRSRSNLYDKVQTTVAYQNFQESRHDRDFQSVIENIRAEEVNALSLNIDLEKQISPKTELFYGFEYVYNMVNSYGLEKDISTNTFNPTVSRYPDGSNWQSIAGYTSLKYKPSNKFIFQSGIRYNQVLASANFTENNQYLNLPFDSTKINSGALTGTAGISWLPNKIIQWKLNASTAFRAPNIDDIGKVFDSEPGSVVVPNDNLKPEYAYGGELGLLLNFNNVFILDVATYYTFLDNALVRRDFAINGETEINYDGQLSNVQAIQNASKAWIYGFELGLKLNFSESVKLVSQYNVIGGSEENNGLEVPVRHVAPNFGNTHLIFSRNRLLIDGFIDYNGELSNNQLAPTESEKDYLYAKDKNGNPYSPSWYTLNLRTQYELNNSLRITLGLENLTDQRYRTYSSGITSPGRNFIVSLNYSL